MSLIFCLFLIYLLAPKIDIIDVSGAGIRPEDFITLLGLIFYLFKPHRETLTMPKYAKLYMIFVAVNYLSALINIGVNGFTGFLYATRLVQYFVWFVLIHDAATRVSYRAARQGLIVVSCVLIIWGGLEYFGLIEKVGRFATVESRLTINTSGPFETSVVLAILAYAVRHFALTPALLWLIWLTQARVTLVAGVMALLSRRPGRGVLYGVLLGLGALAASGPLTQLFERSRFSEAASPREMAGVLERAWRTAPVFANPATYRARFLEGSEIGRYVELGGQGSSFNIRAIRWSTAVKSTLHAPLHALAGMGPGAWGLALDGHYIRVFGETGFLGLILFLYWLLTMYRALEREGIAAFCLATLAIVAIFIDIFSSSKIMPMLWAFAALDHARHPHRFPSHGPTLQFRASPHRRELVQ